MRNDRAARPTQSWPVAGRRLLTRRDISADGRAVFGDGDPAWKGFYRDRWAHDRVVRSTHGVNWGLVPDGSLTADDRGSDEENARYKTVLVDRATARPVVPGGSLGFRWGEAGRDRWNLALGDVEPELSLLESAEDTVEITLPRCDEGATEAGGRRGGVHNSLPWLLRKPTHLAGGYAQFT